VTVKLSYRVLASAVLLLCGTALSGCGGGTSVPRSAASGPTTVTFKIDKPQGTSGTNRRSAKYLSPATSQISIDVQQSGTSIAGYPVTAALTAPSTGCVSTLATTLCQITLPLGPGTYTAILTAKDGNNVPLSTQTIGFTILAGQNNVVPLILSGIPYAIGVTTGANAVKGSATSGLTLYGSGTQPVIVSAFDADGNIIIGPGAPTFSANVVSGLNWDVMSPTTTAPNTVLVSPPGTNGSGATIAVTAVYPDSTCTQPGAVCTRTFSITNHIQTLFVADGGNSRITAYAPPYSGAPVTINNSITAPVSIALNAAGQLLAAGYPNDFTVWSAPYTGAPAAFNSVSLTTGLVLDAAGDAFVANNGANTITEYLPPYTGGVATTISTDIDTPEGMAFDSAGNLFVANNGSSCGINGCQGDVAIYAPPYTGTPTLVTSGIGHPGPIAIDGSGNLFVGNQSNSTVTVFAPPYTGAAIATISTGVSDPSALLLDGLGNLFIANYVGGYVLEFTPPYVALTAVIGNGTSSPTALAMDGAGNLFVANTSATNTVTEYAPPYTGAPIVTITNSVSNPQSLVLSP